MGASGRFLVLNDAGGRWRRASISRSLASPNDVKTAEVLPDPSMRRSGPCTDAGMPMAPVLPSGGALCRDGQGKREGAPRAAVAFHPDASAVRFHQQLRDI